MEEIGPAHALPPELRVEVEATRRESACGQDFVERERQLVDRIRELIGVPTVLVVAAVDVDAAEAAECDRARDFVMKAVTREGRVVRLEVEAVLTREIVTLKETDDGGGVVVVLVLRRLLRLGLDEERAGEADPVLVLRDHRQEPRELCLFPSEIGIEERLIALASAPQDVVRSVEAVGYLEHRLDLRGRVRE